jgi:hypothetical protein
MGKTSLATATLHEAKIVDKYPTRYFVPCDSARTSDSLVAIVASHLSLEPSRDLAKIVIRHLSMGPPCLMILDNFETPWEPAESRAQVEDFLSLLTDVPHLALLVCLPCVPLLLLTALPQITMRGAERPGKVQWNRPFLRPLAPLTAVAARQTFIDIADEVHDDSEVAKLLDLTDNVPLAVQLVATIAANEGCEATLARWKSESTALLSDGFDKRSNSEVSIMLSSPHAENLLRLMSLLSDGIFDADSMQRQLPIPDIFKYKTKLVRTSLAYVDHTGRFRVLTAIREYITPGYLRRN